jgi:hypothetical protein
MFRYHVRNKFSFWLLVVMLILLVCANILNEIRIYNTPDFLPVSEEDAKRLQSIEIVN